MSNLYQIGDKVVCNNIPRCEFLTSSGIYEISQTGDFCGEQILVFKEIPYMAYSSIFFDYFNLDNQKV